MKLVLVTAGFHRLGAAIAARLAENGWALALHGRKPDVPDAALAGILTRHNTPWFGFTADLSDAEAVQHLIPSVEAHFGQAPDLLVNNASQFEWDDPTSVTPASLSAHFNVNAGAPVTLATALASHVAQEQTATVVKILDQLSYTISKLALFGATETLARALAPNVRVNAVAPGLVIPTDDYLPSQMEALRAAMPLGRLPEPDDVADAVLWLASAEVVTGQTIFVDAGAALKSFERDFLFLGKDG